MMPAQSRVDAGIWTVPGQPHFIEYSRSVLNEILLHVVDAYDSYLAGGYEVGGVLFGYHEGFHLRIQAFRPIEIKPPRPSFVLSEKDEAQLADMLKAARSDASLEGMAPIGWYHSHTRSEIFLSEADLEIYSRNFPEAYQVAMVLHPSEHEPVRVGFFFRETDGFIRSDQSYQEFAVDVPPRNPSFRKSPPWKVDFHGHPVEPEPTALAPVEPEEYALAPEPQRATLSQRLGTWGLLALAAIAIGASLYTITALRRPEAGLGLRVSAAGGELVVQWDPNNQAISTADHLELLIKDGSRQSTIPISHKTLKEPVYVYKPASLRVDLMLKAGGSWFGGKQESTTFLAHPSINQPPAELVQIKQEIAQAETESAELRSSLDEQVLKARNLETRIEEINRNNLEADRLAEARKQEQAARRLAGFRPPPAKPAAAPKDLPAAPDFGSRATTTATAPPPNGAFASRPPEPPPPPPRPAAVAVNVAPSVPPSVPAVTARPAAPAATSGRILWTGELPRDGVLTINGRKASKGAVSGELPGGQVRVGAYPAELTTDGLRILTGNPRYSQPRVEPPSAANGWQKTQYVYDPKAVRDLIVEQMPGQNSPKQLTLRGGSRKLSVIVIEWQLATP